MFRVLVTFREIRQSLNRLRAAVSDGERFFRRWDSDGHMKRIMTDHVESGGHDPLQAPAHLRGPFLLKTDPSSSNFYEALRSGAGKVTPSSPRGVWTGNSLRSTYETARFDGQKLSYDTERPFSLFQGATYRRFGGPFFKHLPDQSRLFPVAEIEESLEEEFVVYVNRAIVGSAF